MSRLLCGSRQPYGFQVSCEKQPQSVVLSSPELDFRYSFSWLINQAKVNSRLCFWDISTILQHVVKRLLKNYWTDLIVLAALSPAKWQHNTLESSQSQLTKPYPPHLKAPAICFSVWPFLAILQWRTLSFTGSRRNLLSSWKLEKLCS